MEHKKNSLNVQNFIQPHNQCPISYCIGRKLKPCANKESGGPKYNLDDSEKETLSTQNLSLLNNQYTTFKKQTAEKTIYIHKFKTITAQHT